MKDSNLPEREENFIGREALMEGLLGRLGKNGIIVLKGEGGIGKTWIALESVYRALNKKIFDSGVVWLNCENPFNCKEYIHAIAECIFGDRRENDSNCVEKVEKYLSKYHTCLVFDNYETLKNNIELLKWLVKISHSIPILITTREVPESLQRNAHIENIDELSPEDARNLFIKRAQNQGWDGSEIDKVDILCEKTGYLPLAIELLACNASSIPLSELLSKLDNLEIAFKDDTLPRRHQSLFACFMYSLDRLSQNTREVFLYTSVLPSGIGKDIIARVIEIFGWHSDWTKVASELVRSSMWRLSKSRYTTHRLLREFATKKLENSQREIQSKISQELLQIACEKGRLLDPTRATEESAQTEALDWIQTEWVNLLWCINTLEKISPDNEITVEHHEIISKFSDSIPDFCYRRGYSTSCEELHRRALKLRKNDFAGMSRTYRNLGLIYQRWPSWEKAVVAYKNCVKYAKKGKDRITEAQGLYGLGNALCFMKKVKEAEKKLQRSYNLLRKISENDPSQKIHEGIAAGNLAFCYERMGNFNDSEKFHNIALEIKKNFNDKIGEGITHRQMALLYFNQSNKEQNNKQELLNKAEENAKKSIELFERFRCLTDSLSASCLLCEILHKQGPIREVKECLISQKTISLLSCDDLYFDDRFDLGRFYYCQAERLFSVRQYKEAKDYCEKSWNIVKERDDKELKEKVQNLMKKIDENG